MHYSKINVMVPTKGRSADKLPAFIKSCLSTADNQNCLYFTFVINENDKETETYLRSAIPADRLCLVRENEPACDLSKFFNMAYEQTMWKDEDMAVSLFGDDMVFVTKKWDRLMLDKLNDTCGYGVVYGDDDNVQHENMCVYFIVSRKLVQLTGKPFMCPLFKIEWIDTVWYKAGKELNLLEYLPNLHIRHNHSHNADVGVDKTFVEMRKAADECAELAAKNLDSYVAEIVGNVKKHFSDLNARTDIVTIMTTYDRVYLLNKTVKSLSGSVVLPNRIDVYDDGSVRVNHVRKAVDKPPFVFHNLPHVNCQNNHKRAFKDVFARREANWCVVIDSDSMLYKFWYLKVCEMVDMILDRSIGIAGLFNKGDRNIPKEAPDGYEYKEGVGGIGMIVSRKAAALLPEGDELKTGWDNQICTAVRDNGWFSLATKRSYIQHMGYVEGIHANDRFDEAVCKNFCGSIPEEEPEKQIKEGDKVMVCCMARKIDVVYASVIVNALMQGRVNVTWLTIPHNVRMVEVLANGCTIKAVEPMSGDPYDSYSETTSYKMAEKYPGYVQYINLQMSARENSGVYRNSDLPQIEWLKRKMQRFTNIPMDSGVDAVRNNLASMNLASRFKNEDKARKRVIVSAYVENSEPIDVPVIRDMWKEYVDNSGYDAILLSRTRVSDIPLMRFKQIFGVDDYQILGAISECDFVVGQDSWVTKLAEIAGKKK
jgi:hypothetical protein